MKISWENITQGLQHIICTRVMNVWGKKKFLMLQRPPSLFRRLMGVMRNSTTRSSQSLDSEHSDMGELNPDGQFG